MNACEVRAVLRKKYCEPEWALMEEVSDQTGGARRYADAVAMNLWPSRGLEIHGFEIKVSRSDWLNELKNPAKAEIIAAYCDKWWIVTTPDVVVLDELPTTWGLQVVNGNKIKEVVKAPKREEVKPLDRKFVASLLRRADEVNRQELNQLIGKATAEAQERMRSRIAQEIEQGTQRYTKLKSRVDEISKQTGINLERYDFSQDEFVKVFKFALEYNRTYDGHYESLRAVKKHMQALIQRIDQVPPLGCIGGNQ